MSDQVPQLAQHSHGSGVRSVPRPVNPMNKKSISRASLLGASALLLMSAVQAQRPSSGGTLERARHLFSQIDTDKDGSLSAAEAGKTKIPTRDFVNNDANRDRKLSGDEFLVFYRKLLVKGGKPVGAALDAEVSRIQAARRSTKKQPPVVSTPDPEPVKKDKPVKPEPDLPTGKTDAERAQDVRDAATQERVEAARDQKNAENDARAKAARDKLAQDEADRVAAARAQKQAENEARAAAARKALAEKEAARIAVARAQKEQDAMARAAAARKKLAEDAEAARIAAIRAQKAQENAERAAEARRQHERIEKARAQREHEEALEKHQREAGKGGGAGMGPSERAQAFVKRLADSGRLTPQQARDFHTVLMAKASSANGAGKAETLRKALNRAKSRVGNAVRAGHLTAEEGRVLSTVLDDRAQKALGGSQGDSHDPKPSVGHSPEKDGSESRGTLGAGRKTKPKSAGVRSVGGKGKAGSGATRGDS